MPGPADRSGGTSNAVPRGADRYGHGWIMAIGIGMSSESATGASSSRVDTSPGSSCHASMSAGFSRQGRFPPPVARCQYGRPSGALPSLNEAGAGAAAVDELGVGGVPTLRSPPRALLPPVGVPAPDRCRAGGVARPRDARRDDGAAMGGMGSSCFVVAAGWTKSPPFDKKTAVLCAGTHSGHARTPRRPSCRSLRASHAGIQCRCGQELLGKVLRGAGAHRGRPMAAVQAE